MAEQQPMAKANMDDLFKLMKAKNASDIHLTVGVPPVLRIQGRLYQTPFEPLTKESAQTLIYSIMNDEQRQRFEDELELDFSFGLKALGRLRVNIYKQKGCVAAALRSIPNDFKTFEQLNLPPVVYNIMKLNKGLVLVTGCTGSGAGCTGCWGATGWFVGWDCCSGSYVQGILFSLLYIAISPLPFL